MPNLVSKALRAVGLKKSDQYSNIKKDEKVVFFNTTAWLDTDTKHWNIPIHGWVYEPQNSWALRALVRRVLNRKYGLKVTPETKHNFKQRLNLFIADNERSKRLIIELKGQLYALPKSKPNGQFEGIIQVPYSKIRGNKLGLVDFKAVLKPDDTRTVRGSVKLVMPSGVSVISDIDDTVKQSFINDHKRMFNAAFLQDFKPVNGMPEVYKQWHQDGVEFHFVSSSPWQLYQPLKTFLEEFDFPWSTMSLKKVRIKDETFLNLFKSGLITKPIAIKAILNRYPDRKFILIGDSGEQDAQAYAKIAREHPDQIAKILIRNVHANKELNENYKDVFKDINRRLWKTFVYPSQIRLDVTSL